MGVGIDGSGVWSLWIGGNAVYTYVFQTSGPTPASNTLYHIVLTVSNSAGAAALMVNGITVINAVQQQFTDKTHPITLMSGMGEDWWREGGAQQEIDVANVKLDISDASSIPGPDPTTTSTSPPAGISNPANPTPPPAQTPSLPPNTLPPSDTAKPSLSPSIAPSPTSTTLQPGTGVSLELTLAEVFILALVIAALIVALRHRR